MFFIIHKTNLFSEDTFDAVDHSFCGQIWIIYLNFIQIELEHVKIHYVILFSLDCDEMILCILFLNSTIKSHYKKSDYKKNNFSLDIIHIK